MNYLSICSGIEAASVAWEPLGWKPVGFAEIEPFCRSLLKHYWPGVRNYGDFTKLGMFAPAADLLVAGTPCQDFSVAGLRAGLDGARGNLTLEWLALVERTRFRWLVWENVPGVLSLDEGRAFGYLLGRLAELGYGFAYRILDAQHFGVPQRRRRIFVVGYLGDWRPAAAVLFERSSLQWNPAPSREAGQGVAYALGASTGGSSGKEQQHSFVADPITTSEGRTWSHEGNTFRLHNVVPDVAQAVIARDHKGAYPERSTSNVVIAHTLRADGFDASEDGTGRGAPLVAHYQDSQFGAKEYDTAAIRAGRIPEHSMVMSFTERSRCNGRNLEFQNDTAYALTNPGSGGRTHSRQLLHQARVRRLTPVECERLQGFPDNYTRILYRGKLAADGPRYRALGNSMAVPVMTWIGQRIQAVEELLIKLGRPAR